LCDQHRQIRVRLGVQGGCRGGGERSTRRARIIMTETRLELVVAFRVRRRAREVALLELMSQLVRKLDLGIGSKAAHRIRVGIVVVQFSPVHDGLLQQEGIYPMGLCPLSCITHASNGIPCETKSGCRSVRRATHALMRSMQILATVRPWSVIAARRRDTAQDGFLHFTPPGAHSVLPRWSQADSSRNLAPLQPGNRKARKT
jgi:hypothetical protein